jgi:nucleotide-binding universal stress UspA family protein
MTAAIRPGPVVVGVSPTTGSPSALRWAAEEARLRGTDVVAVLAWRSPRPPAAPAGRPPAMLATEDVDPAVEAEGRLNEFVTAALGPGHGVRCRAMHGSAATALLDAAADAQLLVVGEPRPSRLASLRASLTAPAVLYRAACPVVVLPPSDPLEATDAEDDLEFDEAEAGPSRGRRMASAMFDAAASAGRPGVRR